MSRSDYMKVSLAVYCQGSIQSRTRAVGTVWRDLRAVGTRWSVSIPGSGIPRDLSVPIKQPLIPSRWDGPHFIHTFQAVNCQDFGELSPAATFMQSLWDNNYARPVDIPLSN